MMEKLLDACRFVVKERKCEDVEINILEYEYRAVRFGGNRITQNMLMREAKVNVTAHAGKRKGTASADGISRDTLLTALRKAEEVARNVPEDPEYTPPYEGEVIRGEVKEMKIPSEEEIAEALGKIITKAEREKVSAAGILERGRINMVVANSRGVEVFHSFEKNSLSLTLERDGVTGYAHGWGKDDPEELFERAYEKIKISGKISEIEPGKYTVIFEPLAFSDILPFFLFSLDRREMDEGRSGLSGFLGKRVAPEMFTLKSNPSTFNLPPFDEEGVPLMERKWIEKGILREAMVTRYWAKKKRIPFTGRYRHCEVEEGEEEMEEIIGKTERGILVTRLWYIRWVDVRKMSITGMTRDGTFLIEDGEIKGRVKEMRFNDSVLSILSSISGVGRKGERCWHGWIPVFTPPVKTELSFSSTTRF